jgi:hypothetical protein
MSSRVLDGDKPRIIELQSGVVSERRFFLGGGTGLALHLDHRLSRDLDWFSATEFDATEIAKSLNALPEKPTHTKVSGPRTVRAYYGRLEPSFIFYSQVAARPEIVKGAGLEIPVADIETLALMKSAALHDRGTKRDFIDVHAICSRAGWSMARFIELAVSRLPFQPLQVRRAMTYFVDAEREPMPAGCFVPWPKVKADFERWAEAWDRSRKSQP